MVKQYLPLLLFYFQGFNTYKKFLLMNDNSLKEAVSDEGDRKTILKSLERDRPKGLNLFYLIFLSLV